MRTVTLPKLTGIRIERAADKLAGKREWIAWRMKWLGNRTVTIEHWPHNTVGQLRWRTWRLLELQLLGKFRYQTVFHDQGYYSTQGCMRTAQQVAEKVNALPFPFNFPLLWNVA
jgi:hypothetical protein